jgi:hypothetical protein
MQYWKNVEAFAGSFIKPSRERSTSPSAVLISTLILHFSCNVRACLYLCAIFDPGKMSVETQKTVELQHMNRKSIKKALY